MDTGEGRFTMMDSVAVKQLMENADRREYNDRIFSVGEILMVKGSKFRVAKITPKKLILRLLPRE